MLQRRSKTGQSGAPPPGAPGTVSALRPETTPGGVATKLASPSPHVAKEEAATAPAKTKLKSTLESIVSGLVCGMIIFVFCCVYSSMIFQQSGMPSVMHDAVPFGVGMHTLSTFIGSLFFARLSGCKAIMGGPDINPVVFIAEATAAIAESMCPGGVCSSEAEPKLVPTVLVGVWIANMLVGVCFFLLGSLRMTGVVGFVPAQVTSGFLACIGWKIIKSSFQVASGVPLKIFKPKWYYILKLFGTWDKSWKLILPGIPIGLILYANKRWHLYNMSIVFPVFIIVPTAAFYVLVYASGSTIDEMRSAKWYYPESEASAFYTHWQLGYGGFFSGRIEWSALATALPSWVIMIGIVCLDNMLKLASTESALKIDLDYNREMKIGGLATLANALAIGSPAYGQTKVCVRRPCVRVSVGSGSSTPLTLLMNVTRANPCLAVRCAQL